MSWLCESGITPARLTRPSVGLIPTIELAEAGQTIEPSVSVPTAIAHRLAATAVPDPELDPHGSPIPQKDGTIPRAERRSLVELRPGTHATLTRLPANEPGLRAYLEELGLAPGTRFVLESIEPFGGPVYLRVGSGRVGLGPDVARRLHVLPDPE